jgi:hypothetical protein
MWRVVRRWELELELEFELELELVGRQQRQCTLSLCTGRHHVVSIVESKILSRAPALAASNTNNVSYVIRPNISLIFRWAH